MTDPFPVGSLVFLDADSCYASGDEEDVGYQLPVGVVGTVIESYWGEEDEDYDEDHLWEVTWEYEGKTMRNCYRQEDLWLVPAKPITQEDITSLL